MQKSLLLALFERIPAENSQYVDTLSENLNQIETYIFDAYELIKAASLQRLSKEIAA